MTRITPHSILRHELIGLNVKIPNAKNPSLQGLRGKVVDETRNMLTLSNNQGRFLVPKDVATFRFELPDGSQVDVDGLRLVSSPENRLKTKVRRW
jgi:ribonuclease P protein subunit POP4